MMKSLRSELNAIPPPSPTFSKALSAGWVKGAQHERSELALDAAEHCATFFSRRLPQTDSLKIRLAGSFKPQD